MAIASTLKAYLEAQNVAYEVITHSRTMTALAAAHSAGLSDGCVAKGVLLEDEDGYVLAVVPAAAHVKLGELHRTLNRRLGLATEAELPAVFKDCELGAIPAVGTPYGLEMVVDENVAQAPDVYFEGGDHQTLIHIRAPDFARLMAGAKHGHICDMS